MVDEASKEVLAFQVSHHPNLQLVKSTIDELLQKLPDNAHPIIHSDQGWQYQQVYYAKTLANLHFVQACLVRAIAMTMRPLRVSFTYTKRNCLMDLRHVKILESSTSFP